MQLAAHFAYRSSKPVKQGRRQPLPSLGLAKAVRGQKSLSLALKAGKVDKTVADLDRREKLFFSFSRKRQRIKLLTAGKIIAQGNAKIDRDGRFLEDEVSVRHYGDYSVVTPDKVQWMDVSPKQVVSVATSLIPFLEHDDANRALMGSNMQRQAVPLVFPEAPRVGTGMEQRTAYDSGVLIKAKRAGTVRYVSSTIIRVEPDAPEIRGEVDEYTIHKFERTNQDSCMNQKPIVDVGDHVDAGDVLADGPATDHGELALDRNILVGFVPWNGYNYEDAVLISERVVREDIYKSIHIKEFSIDIR